MTQMKATLACATVPTHASPSASTKKIGDYPRVRRPLHHLGFDLPRNPVGYPFDSPALNGGNAVSFRRSYPFSGRSDWRRGPFQTRRMANGADRRRLFASVW